MPHKPFHIPLRTSSRARAGDDSNSRKDHKSLSILKAQRILGTTSIVPDHDYHSHPDKRTSRSAGYLNVPEPKHNHNDRKDGLQATNLRDRASSPLLGQEYRDTTNSAPPLAQLSRKLHPSGSSSGLYSRYSHRETPAASSTNIGQDHTMKTDNWESPDTGLNQAFKQPKGPMKDSKRKTRPPRIDLSLLFPKPHATTTHLLSPQRMVSSPSTLSTTSDYSTVKLPKSESRLPAKKLTKAPPRPIALSPPEDHQQTLNGVSHATPAVWSNPSVEKTVRTSEMDLALQKDLDAQPTPRSTERALYSQMNFSLRGRNQFPRSDARSFISARSGESAHSSQRTLREATSTKSLRDGSDYGSSPFRSRLRDDAPLNKGPTMSKKSSKSTLKNSDLNNSSVLCLSSSEDEDDYAPPLRPQFKPGKTKRDSVSTYGGYEAEICTAAAAQTTRGTLRSVERPSSSNTQSSHSSSKYLQPRRDSGASLQRKPSLATGNNRSHRSSGVPAILEPNFLHSDPIFDQNKAQKRAPSLPPKEINNRRSRVMAVTRQEERLLEVMRLRQGKITPSIFNENLEPDRRSVVSNISGPSRDSYYCPDTSFLRLSPGIPPPGLARPGQGTNHKEKGASTPHGTGSDSEEKTPTSALSSRVSFSSKSLPSPATSATSPLTPTLPIHRFSPLPSQKPPPRRPPPPIPDLQRNHSRRRTDSSGIIALDDAIDDPRESSEFPVWALGWNAESSNLTAVH